MKIQNMACGCTIELREGDAPIKAWSCEHGQWWVAAGYYEQWVRDGRPLGVIT